MVLPFELGKTDEKVPVAIGLAAGLREADNQIEFWYVAYQFPIVISFTELHKYKFNLIRESSGLHSYLRRPKLGWRQMLPFASSDNSGGMRSWDEVCGIKLG